MNQHVTSVLSIHHFLRSTRVKMYLIFLLIVAMKVRPGDSIYSSYQGFVDEWSAWSSWSPCSRTCGGGVTQQFRQCKYLHGCHGVPVRRKMCNMQSCGDRKDFRGEQCEVFNRVEYQGSKRSWEGYEDESHPCLLTCRIIGSNQVHKSSQFLRDGTRCKRGSLHVCVDGKCEPVGCDLKIGSPKKVDQCGVCGGDGSSCITPVYQWKQLANGPCSASCGGGWQPVTPICRNVLTDQKVENFFCHPRKRPRGDTQSCNNHPCKPKWDVGDWTPCSKTCGGGVKLRKIFCTHEKNATKLQVAEKLCQYSLKPVTQESCNIEPCPHWHSGPWSRCSVTCGTGFKTRNVVCRDALNLPSSSCDTRYEPSGRETCLESLCSESTTSTMKSTTTIPVKSITSNLISSGKSGVSSINSVSIDGSSSSSSSHIDGDYGMTTISPQSGVLEATSVKEKSEVIHRENDIDEKNTFITEPANDIYFEVGEELPREHTLPLIQPYPPMENAVLFDHNAIPTEPTFLTEKWGACSKSCGQGVRKRKVTCKIFLEFSRTMADLPDKECPGPKPPETQSCFIRPCDNDKSTAEGMKKKSEDNSQLLSDSHNAALADSQSSYLRKPMSIGLPPGFKPEDMTYSWKVIGYTPCSASCLGGEQDVMIHCVRDYDQKSVVPQLCMDKKQPDVADTKTCNDHPCPPRWNVSEFGQCSKPCGSGVRSREVSCIHEVTRGNTVLVPNQVCPHPMPRTEMLCNTIRCPPYWEPGNWGRCSRSCGGGVRTRPIYCKQVNALGVIREWSEDEGKCHGEKPQSVKSCNKKPCGPQKERKGQKTANEYGQYYTQSEWKKRISLTMKGHVTIFNGITVKLICPLRRSDDRKRLTWMKGHEYLNTSEKKIKVNNKKRLLKIRKTKYSDSGVYSCLRPFPNDRRRSNMQESGYDGGKRSKESTLFADQQPGVSVPMSDNQRSMITPKSVNYVKSSSPSSSSSSRPSLFISTLCSSLAPLLHQALRIGWPASNMLRMSGPQVDVSLLSSSHENDIFSSTTNWSGSQAGHRNLSVPVLIGAAEARKTNNTLNGRSGNRNNDEESTQSHIESEKIVKLSLQIDSPNVKDQANVLSSKSCPPSLASKERRENDENNDKSNPHNLVRSHKRKKRRNPKDYLYYNNYSRKRKRTRKRRWRHTQGMLPGTAPDADKLLCAKTNSLSSLESKGEGAAVTWGILSWSPCHDSNCFTWNTATRNRDVGCFFVNGTKGNEHLCEGMAKPDDTEECFNPNCQGVWVPEPWTECHASCGELGYRSRIIKCVWFGSGLPGGHACASLMRPKVRVRCRAPSCSNSTLQDHHYHNSYNNLNEPLYYYNVSSDNVTTFNAKNNVRHSENVNSDRFKIPQDSDRHSDTDISSKLDMESDFLLLKINTYLRNADFRRLFVRFLSQVNFNITSVNRNNNPGGSLESGSGEANSVQDNLNENDSNSASSMSAV